MSTTNRKQLAIYKFRFPTKANRDLSSTTYRDYPFWRYSMKLVAQRKNVSFMLKRMPTCKAYRPLIKTEKNVSQTSGYSKREYILKHLV